MIHEVNERAVSSRYSFMINSTLMFNELFLEWVNLDNIFLDVSKTTKLLGSQAKQVIGSTSSFCDNNCS